MISEPPNFRSGKCCGNCDNGADDIRCGCNCGYYCKLYGDPISESSVCDDFKPDLFYDGDKS